MAKFRKAGVRLITGVEELDKKLEGMKLGAANKIARPAIRKGAALLLKNIKAAVPANIKDAKKALGMVVDTKGGANKNQQRAKVGAGVGKKKSKIKNEANRSGNNQGGVGIGVNNIHWFILGTAERETGSKRVRSKLGAGTRIITGGKIQRTGRMPAQAPGLIKDTANNSKEAIAEAIRTEAAIRLSKLAAKGG